MNELIETIFDGFQVDGLDIPVKFLRYNGNSTTYVTYMQTHANDSLSADDELINYMEYYDFDIYSKGDYTDIVEAVIQKLEENNFRWRPSWSSSDMFEDDTGYYHKTLNFAIERSTQNGKNRSNELPLLGSY